LLLARVQAEILGEHCSIFKLRRLRSSCPYCVNPICRWYRG